MSRSLESPCLRPGLTLAEDARDAAYVYIWDQFHLSQTAARVSRQELGWMRFFDGAHSLREIQAEVLRRSGQEIVSLTRIAALARKLDEALFLDGPRYQAKLHAPVREPACIGCYEGDPQALREQLQDLFHAEDASGPPRFGRPDGKLRAALLPHIDFRRGGSSYTWGFKEIAERTDARLFVIVGTSHHSAHRFILTRKHFKTPLGVVPTDQDYVDRLVRLQGDEVFADEIAHLPEHSIELEVVFLQYLYEGRRDFRIVPLLVGPFHDCVLSRNSPGKDAGISRMIAALESVEREAAEPVCYIISGDLAHIGPKFGDPAMLSSADLQKSHAQDQAIMSHAVKVDIERYFLTIAEEADARRICGLPPTYTTLAAASPKRGKLLHYDQYAHPRGVESVSFASMAFYR